MLPRSTYTLSIHKFNDLRMLLSPASPLLSSFSSGPKSLFRSVIPLKMLFLLFGFVQKVLDESLFRPDPQRGGAATSSRDFPLRHGPARNAPCPPFLKGGLGGISERGWPDMISWPMLRSLILNSHAMNHAPVEQGLIS
jgi:hypothetical protein